MQKFMVVGIGTNKKTDGKINIRFEIHAKSLSEAESKAKQEAEKKHPGYDCVVHIE